MTISLLQQGGEEEKGEQKVSLLCSRKRGEKRGKEKEKGYRFIICRPEGGRNIRVSDFEKGGISYEEARSLLPRQERGEGDARADQPLRKRKREDHVLVILRTQHLEKGKKIT